MCATLSLLNETSGNKLLCLLGGRETEDGSWSVDVRVESIIYILGSELNIKFKNKCLYRYFFFGVKKIIYCVNWPLKK